MMLILSRRIGETIIIGEDGGISVKVLGIKGSQVRLGTMAPIEIPVNREEIYNKIQAEKKDASNKAGAV